jgi:hypothetical protein
MIGVMTMQRRMVNIWTPPDKLDIHWEPMSSTDSPGGDESWTWGGFLPPTYTYTGGQWSAYWTWGGSISWGCPTTWGVCAPR